MELSTSFSGSLETVDFYSSLEVLSASVAGLAVTSAFCSSASAAGSDFGSSDSGSLVVSVFCSSAASLALFSSLPELS